MCFMNTTSAIIGVVLPITAKITGTKEGTHLWSGLLSTIALPIVYFFIPESPRWLVSNNRASKAEGIVHVSYLRTLVQL